MTTISHPNKFIIPGKQKPYIMAHRGNQELCPENTLAAFHQAIQDGADILETDLHLSADGFFMCIHDETLDRTTNAAGEVANKTLKELKTISANYGRPGFISETIPTLSELGNILPKDVALALELKTDIFLEEQVCRKLANELSLLGIRERTFVISFSKERVKMVQKIAADIPAGWITLSGFRPDPEMEILGPFWPLLIINPFYLFQARKNNQIVCPLDPNPDSRLWLYNLMKVDAVLTDNPQSTCRKIKKYKFT
jgi:glycerophosphoryl diester phosphodiesterase